MNEFSLKNKIFERAFALGFSACGITPVKEVDADCRLHFDKWLQKGKEARMQYMRNYKDKRFDPRLLVENARSVLVVALNYYPSIHIPENHPQFALYSYGQDYHIVLKEKLNELFSYINTLTPIEGRIFCDTAPIMERYWAQQAGIGFIGKNTQLKLQDTIYSQNLPQRTLSESGLEAITELGTGALKVSWNSYQNPDIYYRVEIFSKKMDLTQPYFVSRIQPATSTGMTINTTTSGEVNRIGELIKGESYQVRLTALMFEPGVDVINDEYSSANLQAVTYFSRGFLWE